MRIYWQDIKLGAVASILLGMLSLYACVTPSTRQIDLNPRAEDCPVLVIENRNFADVVVSLAEPRHRLAFAPGLAVTIVQFCRPVRPRARVLLHAVGGSFDGSLENSGGAYFERGGVYELNIAPDPRTSFLIGAADDDP